MQASGWASWPHARYRRFGVECPYKSSHYPWQRRQAKASGPYSALALAAGSAFSGDPASGRLIRVFTPGRTESLAVFIIPHN